jgi:flagellar basal body P-ring protein FlgI
MYFTVKMYTSIKQSANVHRPCLVHHIVKQDINIKVTGDNFVLLNNLHDVIEKILQETVQWQCGIHI